MTEIWKPIAGFEQSYSVSSHGRVRRETSTTCAKAGHILSSRGLRNGYPSVQLCVPGARPKSFAVHRLVGAAFLDGWHSELEVNHVDGDKSNPRLDNIEIATSSENQLHAYRLGLQSAKGSRNGQAKLTEDKVATILAHPPQTGAEKRSLAKRHGVSFATIHDIVLRRSWRHVGQAQIALACGTCAAMRRA